MMIGAYFENWAQYRKDGFRLHMYPPGLCTHLFYAFARINKTDWTIRSIEWNDETPGGQYEQFNALKQADSGLKTLLSVGGHGQEATDEFTEMTGSYKGRKAFVNSSISLLRKYGFDGLDVDWEFPTAAQRDNFTALLKELKEAFVCESERTKRERLLLTAAVSPTVDDRYNVPAIAKHVDYVMLMSYDYHGTWNSVVGVNSPLYSKDQWNMSYSAQAWANLGMPKRKIIIGLAAYGRGWTLTDRNQMQVGAGAMGPSRSLSQSKQEGIAHYYEIAQLLNQYSTKPGWHNESRTPFLVAGDQWVSYDDKRSITEKVHWLQKCGYGGAFAWMLTTDDFRQGKWPLTRTIREIARGI